MKKLIFAFLMVFAMLTLAACGDSFKQGVRDGMNSAPTAEEKANDETHQNVEDTQEELAPVEEQIIEEKDVVTDQAAEDQTQESDAQEPAEPANEESAGDNPLLDADVYIYDVTNGTGTEKIGEWAEVKISKEVLKSIDPTQFSEFCKSRVKDSGYNWYTVSFEDGTGIQFAGSVSYVATYGTLDSDGCIVESKGTIMVQEDGSYGYTEAE